LDQRSRQHEAKTGSIVKRKPRSKGAKATWWARVTYIDPKTGKRHDLQRRGQSKAHARDLLQALLREIDVTEVKDRSTRERPSPSCAITLRSIT